jgi:hypothetical protein
VLEKAGDESYWIQRIPVLQELKRRPGVRQKQAAWRLERVPSSVVLHKRLDSTDTRWLAQATNLRNNPLEHNLGFFDFGRYHKAPDDAKYAFDRAEDLLQYDLDSDDGEESDDENDDATTDIDKQVDVNLRSDNQPQLSSTLDASNSESNSTETSLKLIDKHDVKLDISCPLTTAQ